MIYNAYGIRPIHAICQDEKPARARASSSSPERPSACVHSQGHLCSMTISRGGENLQKKSVENLQKVMFTGSKKTKENNALQTSNKHVEVLTPWEKAMPLENEWENPSQMVAPSCDTKLWLFVSDCRSFTKASLGKADLVRGGRFSAWYRHRSHWVLPFSTFLPGWAWRQGYKRLAISVDRLLLFLQQMQLWS